MKGTGFCALLAALIIPNTQNTKITSPAIPRNDNAGITAAMILMMTLKNNTDHHQPQ